MNATRSSFLPPLFCLLLALGCEGANESATGNTRDDTNDGGVTGTTAPEDSTEGNGSASDDDGGGPDNVGAPATGGDTGNDGGPPVGGASSNVGGASAMGGNPSTNLGGRGGEAPTGGRGGTSSGGGAGVGGTGRAGMCLPSGAACEADAAVSCCAGQYCSTDSCGEPPQPDCMGTCACHGEGDVCLQRSGPSSEQVDVDEPCCNGLSCGGCVAGGNIEICRCQNAAGSCEDVCSVLDPSTWCGPEMGLVDETMPVEWVCGGDAALADQLSEECEILATGAPRWCCPRSFAPTCE